MIRFVFFGTPEFSTIILENLIAAGYMPAAVVTNPDEPAGRKHILTAPAVKMSAFKFNIPVLQPQKFRGNLEFLEKFKNLKSELAIVAAYGKILPKEVLDIPSRGFINVHPSLLPKYRGASPIQYAILNDDKKTGVTIMKIDEEMDHGPILANSLWPIAYGDTYKSLSEKLAELGTEILIKTIPDYISGKIKPVEQDHSQATYTKIIKKEDGKIDWSKSAAETERMARAYYPWPMAWTTWNGKILKIIEAEISKNFNDYKIKEIFFKNGKLGVKCGKDALIIKKLQLEGGRVLSPQEFLNGHKNFVGSVLK